MYTKLFYSPCSTFHNNMDVQQEWEHAPVDDGKHLMKINDDVNLSPRNSHHRRYNLVVSHAQGRVVMCTGKVKVVLCQKE